MKSATFFHKIFHTYSNMSSNKVRTLLLRRIYLVEFGALFSDRFSWVQKNSACGQQKAEMFVNPDKYTPMQCFKLPFNTFARINTRIARVEACGRDPRQMLRRLSVKKGSFALIAASQVISHVTWKVLSRIAWRLSTRQILLYFLSDAIP